LAAAAARGERLHGDAADFDFAGITGADSRRLDRSSRLLTAAAALALTDGAVKVRGPQRDQAGLFLGATRMPAESAYRCIESIEHHGVGACSAASFARMSVNAPAGACAKLLGLRGPATTVSAGAASGLLAVLLGAEWLTARDDADLLVAAALDERPPRAVRERNPEGWADTDGAACVLLTREPAAAVGDRLIVAGTGLAGPGDVAGAARAALGRQRPQAVWGDSEAAGRASEGVCPFVDVSRLWSGDESCGSAIALLLAVQALRVGRLRSALVLSARGASASCAVFLTRESRP
jgi:3-oxoacyl-[acyl-carrier-protein] synthase II